MTVATTDTTTPTAGGAVAPDGAALAERLFEAAIGTLELFSVHLGTRLGLYEAIDRSGPVTEAGLAAAAGIDRRYAREWLEQQAVAGFLSVDDPAAAAADRRYALPAAHRGVFVERTHPDHVVPFAPMLAGIAGALDEVIDAYRTGDGVPYARYGRDFRAGQGGINRPAFCDDLVFSWLPAAGVARRLASGARVLDLATGHGWSAAAIANAWPAATVVAVDSDEASIAEARANAAEEGADVSFVVADALDISALGAFDVVLLLEALHDMARPVDTLRSVRRVLGEDGVLVVADEAVAEAFTAPGDPLERMMYGWSVSHCLPVAMGEGSSEPCGTALRPARIEEMARDAGYSGFEVVDTDAGFFRLYLLRP